MLEKTRYSIARAVGSAATLAFGIHSASAQIPAFPGAEGFGAYAKGGRGGDVYYVTNTNNYGAGSFRAGLDNVPASGRTIIFAVSGYIPVVSDTNFNVPSNVTIAGQTAPGDGVGLRGGRMLISGSNVIMRHFRIRHGKNGTGGDCLNIASSASSTMLDHISMMFSTDENFSFFNSSVNNFTMQYSNSTWGMERHNAGGLWDLQNGSCHHTLWAHHRTRNPKARPNGLLEWINNVTFHWRNEGFIMGDSQTPANWKANVRGCYYISIDDADDGSTIRSTGLTKAQVASNGVPNFSLYLDNTLYDYDDDGILDGTNRGYSIVSGSEFTPGDPVGANRYYKSATPFTGATGAATVTVDDPLTAYKKVLSSASPLRLDANHTGPLRDELDTLLVDTVVNQYSILVQKDGKVSGEDPNRTNNGEQLLADQYGITNNGFGTLNGTTPPTDSDLDGMPDSWELALNGQNGITYNVTADDHNNVFTSGQLPNTFFPSGTPTGYTFLEEYLHFMAIPHASMAKNTSGSPSVQTVNLAKYTDAFTNAPVYTVSNIRNGTVQQFAANGITPMTNGPIAKFTPSLNFVGRGGFDFNVTDADGSSWTQQFAVLVTNNAAPRDLVWIGDGVSNLWDNATSNWQTSGGSPTTFGSGDTALFDDRGSATPVVNVSGSQLAGSILVTGSKPYTFSGSGNLTSTGTLTKASSTNLTIGAQTNMLNGTFLNGGNTIINNGGNIAGGAIRFTGGSTLTDNTGTNYFTLSPNIEVNSGAVGNIVLSQRAELDGSLSGGGTFNIHCPSPIGDPWGRVNLDGASAGCTGIVNLLGNGNGAIAFRALGGSFNGFPSARVHLSGVDLFTQNYSGGNTYSFGELSGDALSEIRGALNNSGMTTLSVGQLGTSSEFAGVITDGNPSATALSKYGAGILTLSGANTYSGVTAIYEGTLKVLGSLGNTNVFVGGGAKLMGSGPVGSLLTVQTNGEVSPGNNPGAVGTMTTTGGVTINPSAKFYFDLSSNPASGNDRIVNSGGVLNYVGPGSAHYEFNLLDGYLGAGTYTLISGGTGTSASNSPGLTHNLPPTTRQNFSMQRSGGGSADTYVRLVVTNSAGDLTWTGANGGTWDLNATTNFSGGPGGDNKFYNLDKVTFADGASTGTVSVSGTLQPREIAVNNAATAYSLGGSGVIGGGAKLTKTGTGILTIANSSANTFTGGTYLSGGTLSLSNTATPLGTGQVVISGGTLQLSSTTLPNSVVFSGSSAIANSGNSTFVSSTSSTITSVGSATVNLGGVSGILSINGDMSGFTGTINAGSSSGMIRLAASGTANVGSAATLFDLGTAGATLTNRNGDMTIHLGALSGGPNTHLNGRQTSGANPSSTTYIIGEKNLSTTFSGSISHGSDVLGVNIVKTGSGVLTLAGTSSFDGTLDVTQGELAITGNTVVSGNAAVQGGASLSLAGGTLGVGTLNASGTINGYGILNGELNSTGNHNGRGFSTGTPGVLQIAGPVSFDSGTLRMLGGVQSDRIDVADDLSIEGTLQVSLAPGTGFGRYTLATCGGTLSVGAVNLTGISGGTTAHLSTSIAGQIDLVIDDSDEDGLPDSWEMASFGDLASGPDDDDDGDGQSNAMELMTGTLPDDGASRFAATVARTGSSLIELTWPSMPGKSYSVEANGTLSGAWSPVATVPGAASPATTTSHEIDVSSGPDALFYRVALDP